MPQIPLARPNRVCLSADGGTDKGSVGALIREEINALEKGGCYSPLLIGSQFSMKGGLCLVGCQGWAIDAKGK